MVAFSGVAMANSTEVKESTTLKNEIKELATPCEERMMGLYEFAVGDGPDNVELWNKYLSICNS